MTRNATGDHDSCGQGCDDMADRQARVAGELMMLAAVTPSTTVRLMAEQAARIVAQHGLAHGRGWLAGVWCVGGVRLAAGADATYHRVVHDLQVPLGMQLVNPDVVEVPGRTT